MGLPTTACSSDVFRIAIFCQSLPQTCPNLRRSAHRSRTASCPTALYRSQRTAAGPARGSSRVLASAGKLKPSAVQPRFTRTCSPVCKSVRRSFGTHPTPLLLPPPPFFYVFLCFFLGPPPPPFCPPQPSRFFLCFCEKSLPKKNTGGVGGGRTT